MTVARQAPLSMEFSRQEYWGGLPFPSPGNLPDPGINPASPALAVGFLLVLLVFYFTGFIFILLVFTEPPGQLYRDIE